jgi:hypothetical protein
MARGVPRDPRVARARGQIAVAGRRKNTQLERQARRDLNRAKAENLMEEAARLLAEASASELEDQRTAGRPETCTCGCRIGGTGSPR